MYLVIKDTCSVPNPTSCVETSHALTIATDVGNVSMEGANATSGMEEIVAT